MAGHVKTLELARGRLVAHRRRMAGNLADDKVGGAWKAEALELVEVQAAIEAIDQAIADEEALKDEQRLTDPDEKQVEEYYESIDDDPQ
jgi:hypothetical protein